MISERTLNRRKLRTQFRVVWDRIYAVMAVNNSWIVKRQSPEYGARSGQRRTKESRRQIDGLQKVNGLNASSASLRETICLERQCTATIRRVQHSSKCRGHRAKRIKCTHPIQRLPSCEWSIEDGIYSSDDSLHLTWFKDWSHLHNRYLADNRFNYIHWLFHGNNVSYCVHVNIRFYYCDAFTIKRQTSNRWLC